MLRLVKMRELKNRRTSQISGGQQQRVALARALAPRPKVLLLDEPLSALDLKLRKEMQIELKRLQHETGITFVFVTHDQEEALTMSDRIAVMSGGGILQVGSPRDNILDAEWVVARNGTGSVRLTSGAVVEASPPAGVTPAGKVTIVVRPEHAELTRDLKAAPLSGIIENVVYFGTDTHYHVTLPEGREFIVRRQNRRDGSDGFQPGTPAGIVFADAAAQILRD
jgi:spermidine/putrescine transport system ATP-binding protein